MEITKSDERVSVIICVYTMERLRDIHDAVDSVLAQTLKPHEVVVAVDHNEELLNVLKSELPSGIRVVLGNGAPGLSDTRNAAINSSTGDIVAFIDDDAIAVKTWLENLISPFADPNVMAVGGEAVPLWSKGKRPKWFPEELDWVVGCTYKGLPANGNNVRNVIGCNMAFRRLAFKRVGFFRTEVGRFGKTQGVGEEADICLRIKHNMPEAKILFEYNAVIRHKVPAWRLNLQYLTRRSYNEGFYKSIVQDLSAISSSKALSTENSYLRYLLLTSIPKRVRFFYKAGSLTQVFAIMISIAATGFGYLFGKIKNRA